MVLFVSADNQHHHNPSPSSVCLLWRKAVSTEILKPFYLPLTFTHVTYPDRSVLTEDRRFNSSVLKVFTVLHSELCYTLVRFNDDLGVGSGSELSYTPVRFSALLHTYEIQ